jgi:methylaspartate mutase epsilon subunit
MSLLQEEREIILSNEYVEHFDFAEVEEFVKNASKDLFISHNFRTKKQNVGTATWWISNIQQNVRTI